MSRRLGLVVNPAAGKGKAKRLAPRIIKRLTELFPEPIVKFTEKRSDGTQKARAALDAGAEVIACLGGDGSFREVSEALAGTGIPMALLPCGSGNDLARSVFGRKISLRDAISIMRGPAERILDIGVARTGNLSITFATGMGAGFDARVAEGAARIKALSGFPLYLASTLLAFRGFRPLLLEVETGDLRYRGPALMSGAGIGRFMGGGYMLFPEAKMDDSLLDIHIIEPVSFLRLLANIQKVTRGQHLSMPEVHYGQAESVVYRLKDETLAQMDGEVFRVGPGSLVITCEKAALKMWVPENGFQV